jgi:Cytochrome B6-F complex subunit 5.
MIEPILLGIVLGLIPITLAGLFFAATNNIAVMSSKLAVLIL